VLAKGYSEMISGLTSNYDDRHFNRLSRELEQYGGESQVIIVKTKKLETICREK